LIAIIPITCGLFFFALGFAYGNSVLFNLNYSIGVIVANVPEGLLITITVCMALAA
jgi:sodium/potassium-transporting ATPase subunit alpha